ncbi:carbohydrate kinase family protein [Pseudactinotalea sp. HY160]|uniref:carbohydrate kinase family protein n=1 Tax=Pseudactinotalea sp. HY160 TaxID=2654490 RepID=UPI0018833AD5
MDGRLGTRTRVRLRADLPSAEADIRQILTDAGIDLSACTNGAISRVWILNAPEGRRVLSTTPPTHELDEREHSPVETRSAGTRRDTAALLRSSPGGGLDDAARPAVVVVDPDQRVVATRGWEYFAELTSTTDVFMPSRVQLSQLLPDPVAGAHELRRRTGRTVVARLDAEGSLVLPAQGGSWRVVPAPVEVVDTTGAGDSHAGAFTAALSDLRDAQAMIDAVVVATAVVSRTLAAPGATALAAGPAVSDADLHAVHVHKED